MKNRFRALFKRLSKNVKSQEMKILPGQLAFFFMLILIPLVALVISVCAQLQISNGMINKLINEDFPKEITTVVKILQNTSSTNINNIIFYVSALILASNGTYSMISVSNQIYKIKSKGYLYDKLKSIGMLLVIIFLFLFIMLVPMLGSTIIKTLSVWINNKEIANCIHTTYNLLNVPLSWVIIFVGIKMLYIIAPDEKIPIKNVNYGALFTSFSWVLFTKLYSLYIGMTNNINSLYGSISGFIVLMWWIYFLSYIFVLGMALNVSKYKEKGI